MMKIDADTQRYDLFCYGCGASKVFSPAIHCADCGEPMSLRMLTTPDPSVFEAGPDSLWSYRDLLPIGDRAHEVSLCEGATPLVKAPRLAAWASAGGVWVKNEMTNPTGSFKDRQVAVGIARARELGCDTVAVVSSGNVGCAASAYAARAGLRAVLFMHGHAAPGKLAQAASYGGRVIAVKSPSARVVFDLCIEACRRFGWYHLSTAGMYEPFNVEGAKTIAYEIYARMRPDLPDWIVAPVGGGGLLGGIWRGFLDLKRLNLIERIPRLAGIQASGCAPLAKAIETGATFLETLEDPWPNPETIAGGIADDILFDGHTVLPAIRTTGGAAIAVDDAAILEAQRLLARSEGLLCEPTAAVAVAGLARLPERTPETRVCCVVTGNGMKDLAGLAERTPAPQIAEPTLDAIEQAVRQT